MRERQLYEQGLAEFNEGRYFDCHDTLEGLWMETRGRPKRFVQGLIQGAVGLYHAASGNPTGAYSQLTKSLEKLREYPQSYLGVDVSLLVEQLELIRSTIVAGLRGGETTCEIPLTPHIDYTPDPAALADLE